MKRLNIKMVLINRFIHFSFCSLTHTPYSLADARFPAAQTLEEVRQLIILPVFAENCMKMKELGPTVRDPGSPPHLGSTTASTFILILSFVLYPLKSFFHPFHHYVILSINSLIHSIIRSLFCFCFYLITFIICGAKGIGFL